MPTCMGTPRTMQLNLHACKARTIHFNHNHTWQYVTLPSQLAVIGDASNDDNYVFTRSCQYIVMCGVCIVCGLFDWLRSIYVRSHLHEIPESSMLWTVSCRILSNPTVTVLLLYHLIPLLFAPPILHSTNHFLDREVFKFTCDIQSSLELLSDTKVAKRDRAK